MNLEEFAQFYVVKKDAELIEIECEHELHDGTKARVVKKQSAKRNIIKRGKFICRDCLMKFDNPMNHIGEGRQNDELIFVICTHPQHEGEKIRQIKKSAFFGSLDKPEQICKSCAQLNKEIPQEQRERIRLALTGIKRSDEFKKKISDYMKTNPEGIARATKNVIENRCTTGMLGKIHSNETKEKMSKSHHGKIFTDNHRKNISEGRKKMLAATGGFTKEHREKLSEAAARQYARGFDPKMHHKKGWHESIKAGKVFYRSSYEKKAYLILDADQTVRNYWVEPTNIKYFNPLKKVNCLYLVDIEVEHVDNSRTLIEVKPECWLKDIIVSAKLNAAQHYAIENNLKFETWTEIDLFGPVYNKKHIINFVETLNPGYAADKKKSANLRSKINYQKHIAQDKVEVFCEYCQTTHNPLKLTYDKNIARNGKYICEREGGFIAGSRPKKKKENPYASEGKKQCNGPCGQIKPFEEFGLDKAKSDGYATQCKTCRAEKANKKYKENKDLNAPPNNL